MSNRGHSPHRNHSRNLYGPRWRSGRHCQVRPHPRNRSGRSRGWMRSPIRSRFLVRFRLSLLEVALHEHPSTVGLQDSFLRQPTLDRNCPRCVSLLQRTQPKQVGDISRQSGPLQRRRIAVAGMGMGIIVMALLLVGLCRALVFGRSRERGMEPDYV